jgi:hypothetical protein
VLGGDEKRSRERKKNVEKNCQKNISLVRFHCSGIIIDISKTVQKEQKNVFETYHKIAYNLIPYL